MAVHELITDLNFIENNLDVTGVATILIAPVRHLQQIYCVFVL